MKTITVKVNEDDVKAAEGYFSTTGCVLCQALKRNGFTDVSMGGFGPQIGGIRYIGANKLTNENLFEISTYGYPQNALGLTFSFISQ